MHIISHLLISWTAASAVATEKRERIIMSVAGIVPDVDAAGILIDLVKQNKENTYQWYAAYHHVLAHNIMTAIAISIICWLITGKRWKLMAAALAIIHLHLLLDLLGSGGVQGSIWPLYYLYPISNTMKIEWQGQWPLNGWQNVAITAASIIAAAVITIRSGHSPVEIISKNADKSIVAALRKRWPQGNTKNISKANKA